MLAPCMRKDLRKENSQLPNITMPPTLIPRERVNLTPDEVDKLSGFGYSEECIDKKDTEIGVLLEFRENNWIDRNRIVTQIFPPRALDRPRVDNSWGQQLRRFFFGPPTPPPENLTLINEELPAKIVVVGMGGVGKSSLGNVLKGSWISNEPFLSGQSAVATTKEVKSVSSSYRELNLEIFDTPGYAVEDTKSEEKTKKSAAHKAIRAGLDQIGDGVHVIIFVTSAANVQTYITEAKLLENAKILNKATFKHCMVVVTHSKGKYPDSGVSSFLENIRTNPVNGSLLNKIDDRVVLVDVGVNKDLENVHGLCSHAFESEKRQARRMVLGMIRHVLKNTEGAMYPKDNLEEDLKSCFPGSATVNTIHGKKKMEELQVNDEVLIINKTGDQRYEPVVMFSHAAPGDMSSFICIITDNKRMLRLSPNHLLHVGEIDTLKAAKDVIMGDVIFTVDDDEAAEPNPTLVTAVKFVTLPGNFCPHTPSGNIVVDGVFTSCYTDRIPTPLVHAAMFPVRLLHRVLPMDWFTWVFPFNEAEGMPSALWYSQGLITLVAKLTKRFSQ